MAHIRAAFRDTKHVRNQLNGSLSLFHCGSTIVLTTGSKTRELDTMHLMHYAKKAISVSCLQGAEPDRWL